ncbi:histidine phosphatase family protein [Caloranaerobacter azorensis]|nr:histidine phosphatase family protein [Caloranaerobacter azorensis]
MKGGIIHRAIDTANYIKGDKNIEIIITESLKEMGFGSWEGMEYVIFVL